MRSCAVGTNHTTAELEEVYRDVSEYAAEIKRRLRTNSVFEAHAFRELVAAGRVPLAVENGRGFPLAARSDSVNDVRLDGREPSSLRPRYHRLP
jgi:hypothetical protein